MGYSTPWDLVNVTSHYPEDHYNKGLDMATLLLSMHHAILTRSDLGCIAKVWTTKVANPVVYPLLKKLKKNDATNQKSTSQRGGTHGTGKAPGM